MKTLLTSSILLGLVFLAGCGGGGKAVPKDKLAYVGVWQSPSGFQLQILPEGYVNVFQPMDSLHPEYKSLRVMKANAVYNFGFQIEFLGDSILHIKKPYHAGKQYAINKSPYFDADTMKMVLNGVTLRKFNEEHFMEDMF
ncbi:MAG: hypothetical protein ACM3ME_05660 [Chloroflexota bacterium]|nr:hypothetical protein [Lentimicrobium sp.]